MEVELHTLSKATPILLVVHRHTTIVSISALGERFTNKFFKELSSIYTYFINLSILFKIKFLIQFLRNPSYQHPLSDY